MIKDVEFPTISQICDVIQSDVTLHLQVHYKWKYMKIEILFSNLYDVMKTVGVTKILHEVWMLHVEF